MSIKVFYSKLKFFFYNNLSFSALVITFLLSFSTSLYLIHFNFIYDLWEHFWKFYVTLTEGNFFLFFFFVFSIELIFIAIVYLNGLSISGFAFTYIFVFIFGIFVGTFIGYCCLSQGWNGYINTVLKFFPSVLIFSAAYLLANREAFAFSKMICKAFAPSNKYNFYDDFKLYSIRFLIFVCTAFVSSLVHTLTGKYI